MKLVIVVGAHHFDADIVKILKEAKVSIYSKSNITGHRENNDKNIGENWFASSNFMEESVLYFSFTRSEKASEVMNLVKSRNESLKSKSRLRAFIMPVEDYI